MVLTVISKPIHLIPATKLIHLTPLKEKMDNSHRYSTEF